MADLYDRETARHYAAYRPPLHSIILRRVLADGDGFSKGLDIGCGTGYSAEALAGHCEHVYGVEPSRSMLDRTVPNERITYVSGAGAKTSLPDRCVDIVTFAGSLFYAKSGALVEELQRVCLPRALVIPYDFEILLDDILRGQGIRPQEIQSDYDHAVNFSDTTGFAEIVVGGERIEVELSATELAHVMLADAYCYRAFVEKYGVADPFAALASDLEAIGKRHTLGADIYYSAYRIDTE
jgi:SAM-dependent methyltransferase